MRTQFPPFDQVALEVGNQGNVQVIGLSSQQLYLAAWQSSSTGNWMVPSYNALAFAPKVMVIQEKIGIKLNKASTPAKNG